MRTFTLIFTVIGIVLCLVHYLFHDYNTIYMIFYALSVPAWFSPLVVDVYGISTLTMLAIYLLTIASWALVGYIIDRLSEPRRRRSRY
jgi:hypothetical protein